MRLTSVASREDGRQCSNCQRAVQVANRHRLENTEFTRKANHSSRKESEEYLIAGELQRVDILRKGHEAIVTKGSKQRSFQPQVRCERRAGQVDNRRKRRFSLAVFVCVYPTNEDLPRRRKETESYEIDKMVMLGSSRLALEKLESQWND